MNFIFDMDGVLINSEPLHARSRTAVLESLGVTTDMDMSQVIGSSTLVFWENMIEKYDLDASAQNLERIQMAVLIDMMKKEKCQPPDGLFELLTPWRQWVSDGRGLFFRRMLVEAVLDYLVSRPGSGRLLPGTMSITSNRPRIYTCWPWKDSVRTKTGP